MVVIIDFKTLIKAMKHRGGIMGTVHGVINRDSRNIYTVCAI